MCLRSINALYGVLLVRGYTGVCFSVATHREPQERTVVSFVSRWTGLYMENFINKNY